MNICLFNHSVRIVHSRRLNCRRESNESRESQRSNSTFVVVAIANLIPPYLDLAYPSCSTLDGE